jgi:DNA polymerase-3 subunit epsilon
VSLNFVAIDFETANASPASPCAVGLVRVRNGRIDDSLALTFMPPAPHDWFNEFNIKIHGIRPSDVADGPYWHEVLPLMLEFIGDDVLIAHNAQFDMGVLREAAAAVEVELPDLQYLCSLLMSRKTYNLESYRLNAVAYAVGHEEFDHHDALADADACARIVIHMAGRNDAEDLVGLAAATKQVLKSVNK